MITIYAPNCNHICQKIYDDIILNIPLNKLTCTCRAAGNITVHAYYCRFIINDGNNDKEKLRICRVKCSICNKTHALLLSSMVPYSQIPLNIMTDAITCIDEKENLSLLFAAHPALNESNVRYIYRMYLNHWRLRLLTQGIILDNTATLVMECFEKFVRQFMQIKRTPNILFFNTT